MPYISSICYAFSSAATGTGGLSMQCDFCVHDSATNCGTLCGHYSATACNEPLRLQSACSEVRNAQMFSLFSTQLPLVSAYEVLPEIHLSC